MLDARTEPHAANQKSEIRTQGSNAPHPTPLLKAAGLTLGGLALGAVPGPFQRRALAAAPGTEKKLLFIFQTGGNDGLNTVIPRGDPDYSTTTRPTLFIPENLALDTGNGFAQLHPGLQPLSEIYNHVPLNGQPGAGNLAVLHRIGYAGQSQSHFDSQQYWQNGVPGNARLEEGFSTATSPARWISRAKPTASSRRRSRARRWWR